MSIQKAAVNSGLLDLYEIDRGQMRLTGPSAKLLVEKSLPPVRPYFEMQSRFKALSEGYIEEVQSEVEAKWQNYRRGTND